MSQINPNKIIEDGVLKPSSHTQVAQVGVDLTISEDTIIEHGQSKNVALNEQVELSTNIFSLFIHRSTYNRQGVLITGSVYDPGYRGQVHCTIYNLSGNTIEINKNTRIGQMVFFEADAASRYNGQYQGEGL